MGTLKDRMSVPMFTSLSKYDFEGSLDKLIEQLNKIRSEHAANATVDIDLDNDCGSGCCGGSPILSVYVRSVREETDEEYEKRQGIHRESERQRRLAAKNRKIAREQEELAVLNALAKKYKKTIT